MMRGDGEGDPKGGMGKMGEKVDGSGTEVTTDSAMVGIGRRRGNPMEGLID